MGSRQAILFYCVIISALVYAALFYAAPRIVLLRSVSPSDRVLRYFKVDLREAETRAVIREDKGPNALATRPGSVRDLLHREEESIALDDPASREMLSPRDLADRLALDSPERRYDLAPSEAVLARVDARILEIAEKDARRDIDVTRRLVRPSSDRIVPEGAMPVLRGALPAPESVPLRYEPSPGVFPPSATAEQSGESGNNKGDKAEAEAEKPPFEENVLHPAEAEAELPPLPVENVVDRAPVLRAVEKAKAESTFDFMDDLVEMRLDAYVPPGEQLGYFRLRILPKDAQDLEVLPKDVTFIIDASRSITQHKLNTTVKGIRGAIDMLRPEDRFNVVVFRDTPTMFAPNPLPATPENREAGKRYLSGLRSEGETDVYKAILPVVQTAPREGVPGVILVVSDGRPTTGLRDGRMIINGLTVDNNLRNSIFAFGGGRTVNRYLLDLLAYRNKGETGIVSSIDDIDNRLPTFFAKLKNPLLVDLSADFGRVDESQLFPREIPDFYKDRPVTLYGRFDPAQAKDFFVRITGRAGHEKKELVFRESLKDAKTGDINIARSWAFQKSYYLIGEISRLGETPALLKELQALSRKYNIRTTYTE